MKGFFSKILTSIGYVFNSSGAILRQRFTKRAYSELLKETEENYKWTFLFLLIVGLITALSLIFKV